MNIIHTLCVFGLHTIKLMTKLAVVEDAFLTMFLNVYYRSSIIIEHYSKNTILRTLYLALNS